MLLRDVTITGDTYLCGAMSWVVHLTLTLHVKSCCPWPYTFVAFDSYGPRICLFIPGPKITRIHRIYLYLAPFIWPFQQSFPYAQKQCFKLFIPANGCIRGV